MTAADELLAELHEAVARHDVGLFDVGSSPSTSRWRPSTASRRAWSSRALGGRWAGCWQLTR